MAASLNTSFYPILLSRMEEPLTTAELEAYFQELVSLADACIRSGERYVVIVLNDPIKFTAGARRTVAEVQARYLTPERNDVTLAAYIPLDNAFARGVVTALRWVSPDIVKSIRFVRSLEVACRDAIEALESHGTPFQGDLLALRRALGVES